MQIKKVVIKGLASQKIVKTIEVNLVVSAQESLLGILLKNNVTIASSCGGVGSCQKCVVNHDVLSCQITLEELFKEANIAVVEVAYL